MDIGSYKSREILKAIPEEKAQEFLAVAYKSLEEIIDINSPALNRRTNFMRSYDAKTDEASKSAMLSRNIRMHLHDSMVYFPKNYKPALDHLEKFLHQASASDKLLDADKASVANDIFTEAMSNSFQDFKTIERFVNLAMPFYDKNSFNTMVGPVNLYTIKTAVSSLGKRGAKYLPIFQSQLENLDRHILLSMNGGFPTKNSLRTKRENAERELKKVIISLQKD